MAGAWMFDLDDTITACPAEMRTLMSALHQAGCEVCVLSGTHHSPATDEDAAKKKAVLDSLGFVQGRDYDHLVVVSGPEHHVGDVKADYMTTAHAAALVDDRKRNVKAASRAGIMALQFVAPKGA